MVAVGSKVLPLRRPKTNNLVEDCMMGGEAEKSNKLGRGKKGMGRKPRKESSGFDGGDSNKNRTGRGDEGNSKSRKFSKQHNVSESETSYVRQQVDPETSKYLLEIANLFESNGVEVEERSVICGNALEETRGKELEVATDYILSHTLQTLLEGCDIEHLCAFLRSCAQVFPSIAMDRSGSHVAETALKSLSMHMEDGESYALIEETLNMICKVIAVNPVDLMCNCQGSHVLRSLLCLCKGVPIDSPEFHGTKSSATLAERLNFKASWSDENGSQNLQQGFPDVLKFLVSGMFKCSRKDMKAVQVDQFGTLVLQTALKALKGHDQELLQTIPILLGCNNKSTDEGINLETNAARGIINSMKETAYSHLMEVILEVAPESLYDEIFTKIFKDSLFKIASDHCGSFVIQALVSHTRSQEQMELIWEELGSKFKDLLEMGRSGVIASLIAATQRLQILENKCSQALAAAVRSADESPKFIVPRLLFLESYFFCEDKSSWNWPSGARMHVMGSLILQAVFRYRSEYIQPFVSSITSLETDQVLEAAKNAAGARVIEAFLASNTAAKQKRKLVARLRGHFGALSMQSSGSFTVEKCFNVCNLSLRETIVSELLAVRPKLSKTKQGPYLLRKLDVDSFDARPDQWRSRQASKESTFKDFYATFGSGSNETKSCKDDSFLADSSKLASNPQDLKKMRKEIDDQLGISSSKHPQEKAEQFIGNEKFKKRKNHGHNAGFASKKQRS